MDFYPLYFPIMNEEIKFPWKTKKEAYQKALNNIKGRMNGTVRSFKTPWQKWNDAGVDGIEWHSTIVIGGRPGSGKTLIKDQIIRGVFDYDLNPQSEKIRVLEFSLEMVGHVSATRELSSHVGKSYKDLLSASSVLPQEDYEKCIVYAKNRLVDPVDVVEEAYTVTQFEKIVTMYMEKNKYDVKITDKEGVEKIEKRYAKTVITVDHSLLLRKDTHQKTDIEMLFALGAAVTGLKRKYPIIFIILSQLNRNIDSPERNEDAKYGNFVLESDIYGSDALLQHADFLVGLNRPAKQKIRYYGREKYIIDDESILAVHFLKCRNGDVRLCFFKAEFERMKITEIPIPQQQKRITL
jgi:replicative DNA helicase